MAYQFHRRFSPAFLGAIAAAAILLTSCMPPITVDKIGTRQQTFSGIDYFLTRSIVDLTIQSSAPTKASGAGTTGSGAPADPSPTPTLTLSIDKVHYVPDPLYHYGVNFNHDAFYDDDISVATDENGLLKSVDSITADRTPDIIQKIAEAPGQILTQKLVAGTGPKVFTIKYSLDPTSPTDVKTLNDLLSGVFKGDAIKFIARPAAAPDSLRSSWHPDCDVSICFRTAMPYVLELSTATSADPFIVARQVVVLPNRHVVGQIPITRAAFVTKEFHLAFTNGMLTSAHLKNPSEALAFIQIPISVAKAIVSIPSAMFQFKTTQVTADNNLLTAQQKNLDLQKQIIDTQRQLLAAQSGT